MTQASNIRKIVNHARISRRKIGTGYVAIKNQLKTHEIEHDASVTQSYDYQPCEIPPDSYRDDL